MSLTTGNSHSFYCGEEEFACKAAIDHIHEDRFSSKDVLEQVSGTQPKLTFGW